MPKKYAGKCEECNKTYKGSSKSFCSWDCYVASRWAEVTCNECNGKFRTRKIYLIRGQMKYCSPQCGHIASRTRDAIILDGIRFAVDANGYYSSTEGKGIKLHRYIWAKLRGPIPDGYVVHHKNEVKIDNRIENLSLQKWGDHTSEHSRDRWKSGKNVGRPPSQNCRELGCERKSKARGLCTLHYQRVRAKERGRWL